MLNVNIKSRHGLKLLCLGAHCDDIEIGCGGTILQLLQESKIKDVYWVVFSSDANREDEARRSASAFLKNAKNKRIEVKYFRNGYFPYIGEDIKILFENIKNDFFPDIIFTHYRNDLHQDHRTVSDLTWNTFRNHLVLEYEIPKYDGEYGIPNFFLPLDRDICRMKIENILNFFKSQRGKHWLTKDLLYSLLRIRGMECVSPTKFAEAFYCRKTVLSI